jgi:hypothetical protein
MAGSTDKDLFYSFALSVTVWGSPSPTKQPATLPDLGRDSKLASVQAQRAMEEGWMVLWGLQWEET